jgi:hypothetical protein
MPSSTRSTSARWRGGEAVLDLAVTCTGVTAPRDVATPTLRFGLELTERPPADDAEPTMVKILALRCQIRIEPARRDYHPDEQSRLLEMFGAADRWRDNLHPLQFAQINLVTGTFAGTTRLDADVPVTYDLEVSTAKYFEALSGGEVPFILLFSGSAFAIRDGRLAVTPVSWSAEARTRMPISVWRSVMDTFFPGTAYLRLHRDTLAALQHYKSNRALPGWDAAILSLLDDAALHSEGHTGGEEP